MKEVCLPTPPTEAVTLSGVVDTAASPACHADLPQYCVIAGTDVTVHDVSATGARPLVIIALGTLTVDGLLDASSRRLPSRIAGPGVSDAASSCTFGPRPGPHGGGAGGSFGSLGGDGKGHPAGVVNHSAEPGGTAAMFVTTDPDALIPGCHGQDAGNVTENRFGLGGRGGGAVYLIARGELAITTTGGINASGEGGAPGQCVPGPCHQDTGGTSNAGGGGGSGGMIVLEAPTVSNAGRVWADGGGGGQGASRTLNGAPGADPSGATAALGGTTGNNNGGDGGNGSFLDVAGLPATAGEDGGSLGPCGGGGGGGGGGIIRVYSASLLGPGPFSPLPDRR